MPQEIADFLEGGRGGEIVDVVPAVGEHATISVEKTNCRGCRDDILESCLWFFCCRHSDFFRLQDDVAAGELLHDRKQACVKEADLEEHEEGNRAIDAVGERIEHGGRKVQTERQLNHRLSHDDL